MIDGHTEQLLTPSQVCRLKVFARAGRPVSLSTFWRWTTRGARTAKGDRVRLETIRLPAGTFSSLEAVDRVRRDLNELPDDNTHVSETRERQINQAEQELAAAGVA
jgi:hypothetical protein